LTPESNQDIASHIPGNREREAEFWHFVWLNPPPKLSEAVHAGAPQGSSTQPPKNTYESNTSGGMKFSPSYLTPSMTLFYAMPLWSSITSYLLGNNSKSTSIILNDQTITPESPSKLKFQLERTPSIPIMPSQEQEPALLPNRSIDPSQTLQLPFHESQKAETPFINSLGECMITKTPPGSTSIHAKLPSSKRMSLSLTQAGEEGGTWQDRWVKIVDLEKEMEKQKVGQMKKRSKKEWRNEEVEPVKKKAKDHNRSLWAKTQSTEKVGTNWRPEISSLRRAYT
jgi:hypothetical protein